MLIVGTAGGNGSVLTIFKRYPDTIKPSHLQFIRRTIRLADIVLTGGDNNHVGIKNGS